MAVPFRGTTTLHHNGFLISTTSLLLLLLSLLFLFPLCLLDMQPIQHRPSATNAPWLIRHIIHATMLEKMADIFHVPLTYLQPDQSLFIERAAEAYGKKGKIEAQHLAFELTELFASGELTPQDMDGIMYEMHKAYFKYREQKREKERIMNL